MDVGRWVCQSPVTLVAIYRIVSKSSVWPLKFWWRKNCFLQTHTGRDNRMDPNNEICTRTSSRLILICTLRKSWHFVVSAYSTCWTQTAFLRMAITDQTSTRSLKLLRAETNHSFYLQEKMLFCRYGFVRILIAKSDTVYSQHVPSICWWCSLRRSLSDRKADCQWLFCISSIQSSLATITN